MKKLIHKYRNSFIFLLLIFAHSTYAKDTLSVLFLGNSYTSANNLPLLVNNLSTSAGKTLLVDSNTPGGYTINGHLNDPTSIGKIHQGNWDFIVLQEQSQIPSIDYYRYNSMYPSLMQLKDTIELYNPCAKIITYMTWGRRFGGIQCGPSNTYCSPNFVDFNHMQDSLSSAYLQISNQLNVQVAPVGIAWQNILNDTSLVLHSSDNSHPNIDGSYVAACSIFSSLWKEKSSGLNYTGGLSTALAKYYQSISDSTVFKSSKNWNLRINQPSANFSESISGYSVVFTNLSASIHHSLEYFWDFGDGNTDSSQNPIHNYSTDGQYTVRLIASNCLFLDTLTKIIPIGNIGTQEIAKSAISIYSNSASNEITILVGGNFFSTNYTIFDVIGKPIFKGQIVSEKTFIDIGNLSSGIYLIDFGAQLKQTFKVIKE